jgi:hypothetical protein
LNALLYLCDLIALRRPSCFEDFVDKRALHRTRCTGVELVGRLQIAEGIVDPRLGEVATGGIGQGSDDARSQLGRAGDRRVLGFARLHLDDGITGTARLEGSPGLLEELLGLCAGPLMLRELLLAQEALALVLRLALLDLRHHGLEPLVRFGGAGVLGSSEVVLCLLYVLLGERLITELE